MKTLESPYTPVYRKAISCLETLSIHSGKREVIKDFDVLIEAPEWMDNGDELIYNSLGKFYKINLSSGKIISINTGFAANCNNDHVLSPDQSKLAFSHNTVEDGRSRIYITSLDGGQPELITPMAPSYLHSWSPDGRNLAYCAERNGSYDIHVISSQGGQEKRLTENFGHNDGPEFTPCGEFIYFNSTQSGLMQIWRMRKDGSDPVQITHSRANHWFPHISPDGKYLSCVIYHADDVKPEEHPPHKHVLLKVIDLDNLSTISQLELFGGQGTINVNSWSPDSLQLAFVSYTPL